MTSKHIKKTPIIKKYFIRVYSAAVEVPMLVHGVFLTAGLNSLQKVLFC